MQTQSAETEQRLASPPLPDKAAIRKGLMEAGIPESRIEISQVGCMGYAFDVGPVSLTPLAVVGVKEHADVEKAVRYAYEHRIPINARGAGSGLPGQSVGAGIVLDMRSLDKMEILEDHPDGGKIIFRPARRHLHPAEQLPEKTVRVPGLLPGLHRHGDRRRDDRQQRLRCKLLQIGHNPAPGSGSARCSVRRHQPMDLGDQIRPSSPGTGFWSSSARMQQRLYTIIPWCRKTLRATMCWIS